MHRSHAGLGVCGNNPGSHHVHLSEEASAAVAVAEAAAVAAAGSVCGSDGASSSRTHCEEGQGGKLKPPGYGKAREEDYFGVCHTDVVKCIIITDGGKIFTGG